MLSPLAAQMQKIQKWEKPETVTKVETLLGIYGYYRKFIREYSVTADPRKATKWTWGKSEKEAFNELKQKIISYSKLRKVNFRRPFIKNTDASCTFF